MEVLAKDLNSQGGVFCPSAQAGMSRVTAYAFSFGGLAGGDIRLSEFAGRPLLIVNTASLCGFTPQYAGLQELWTEFSGRSLMIVGVPSNDFGGQEPGSATEIAKTAQFLMNSELLGKSN